MSGAGAQTDRHVLLELDALLEQIQVQNPHADQPWARLCRLRNMLAHDRLPDIDEDEVWRMTAVRPAALRDRVRGLLR